MVSYSEEIEPEMSLSKLVLRRRETMSKPAVDKELLNFVELLSEEYNCPICLGFLQEPYLTACCGNHFCKECIGNVMTKVCCVRLSH